MIQLIHWGLSSNPVQPRTQVRSCSNRGGSPRQVRAHLISLIPKWLCTVTRFKTQELMGKGLDQIHSSPMVQPGLTCQAQNSHDFLMGH